MMQSINELVMNITDGTRAAHAFACEGRAGEARRAFINDLAAGLLCTSPEAGARPCGRCPSCLQAAAGTSMDIVRMSTSTGSNIVDRNLNGIRRLEIDRSVIDSIVRLIRPRGNRISIDIDGVINVFEKMDYPGDYNVISGMDDAPQGMVHGVGIHCETLDEAAALTAELNEKFGASLNAFQNVIEVDIAPKGCSKGAGVQAVRDYFGDCKVYGIGDSLNDLPLLLASDVSYTFPYAPAELQEKVTKIVPTIVEALEDSMQDPL